MPISDLEALPRLSRRIAKNTTIVFLGQGLSLAANLGVTVLLARHLGEAGFGLFSYAIIFVSFFAIIADFGMKPILVREISRHPQRSDTILGNAILVKLALSVLAMILVTGAAVVFGFSSELRVVTWILAGNILLSSKLTTFRILFESIFQARLSMEIPVLCQTLDAVVLVSTIALLVQTDASLMMLAGAYVLSNVPGFLLTLVWSWKVAKPKFVLDRGLCRMLLQQSLPILLYVAFMTFYDRLDVILLQAMKGQSFVGLYAAAFRLVNPLNFIPLAVVTSLYPLMSKYSTTSSEHLGRTYAAGMKILGTIGLPLALGGTIFGDRIFEVLYPQTFAPSAKAFKLLVWAKALVFLNFFLVDFNTSVDRQGFNLWAALSMCLVNLGLDLLLIPRWDIVGASAAKLLTNVVGFGLLFWFSCHRVLISFAPTAAKLSGVAVIFLVWLLAIKTLSLMVALVSSGIVYLMLLMWFGVFDAQERRLLGGMVGRTE